MDLKRGMRAFFFVCTAIATAQTGPVVTVAGGQIRGRPSADGGAEFKGISYALPPLGELRWREPQPVAAWSGIRDAAAFSVACTQISEGWNLRYVQSSAEDCLYLNVAAPVWPPAVKFPDRKSTRLNSSHLVISYAVFCLKKKKKNNKSALTTDQRPLYTGIYRDITLH